MKSSAGEGRWTKVDYHITQEGKLRRDGNTVSFVNQEGRRALPVERIRAIYAYKTLSLSAGVIGLLCKQGIPVHFFGWYGNYEGTLWPREVLLSGEVVLRQAEHYLDPGKRIELARLFVKGSISNLARNISYYAAARPELKSYVEAFQVEAEKLQSYGTISQLMSAEGHVRDAYYEALDSVFSEEFRIGSRERRPPTNKGNALLSFANSLVYTTVLSEIYSTHLNPTISFLHEPYERRFSLALDVAEIFKPILADRTVFKLVNKRMLADSHFEGTLGDMALSDAGRRLFLESYQERLRTTIKHKGLGREVSYQRLIRLELYKLEQHLVGGRKYRPLVMWW